MTVDRPDKRNALNALLRTELKDVLDVIEADGDVRVLVLTGSDESAAFVAEADVSELRERNVVEQREASKRPHVYEYVDDLALPVIARINGLCLGGGNQFALGCDIHIDYSKRTVQNWIEQACERAAEEIDDDDYRRVSTHDLRRCWVHHLLVEEGVSPRIVILLGCWSSRKRASMSRPVRGLHPCE